jgi:enamine deaminase RidA (YjgF/YER057c/UK114 family)
MKKLNPTTIAPPFARYSHAVEVPAEARLLYLAGQVGVTPEGELPSGAEAQIELAWQNILAVLDAAGMGADNLVKVNVYLVDGVEVALYRAVRDRLLGGVAPASTLIKVAGLASPDWLVEIDGVAPA